MSQINVLETNIGGIKCDKEDCNYTDENVKVEDYPQWVNKPCPKCESNLLTEADYDNIVKIQEVIKLFQNLSPEELAVISTMKEMQEFAKLLNIQDKGMDEIVELSLEMNGTGTVNCKFKN